MRNYIKESEDLPGKKYSYKFDEYMRHAIVRTWKPFFLHPAALEVGGGNGELTKYLKNIFVGSYLDCIDPLHNCCLEDYSTEKRYHTIIAHNVFEHAENPDKFLKIAKSLLAEGGRLFISVPNANAPSRQIACHMELIPYPQYVTDGEYLHGHRRTYDLNTLCRDVRESNLKIVKHGGVFFKPMANFQIDAALDGGIITPEYMEGCYRLGEHYPDLCSEIYVIAE